MKTSIIILVIDNHNKNPAMLAIKDLNNITCFENRFLQYKPIYLYICDACYDEIMMMQYMMMYVHGYTGLYAGIGFQTGLYIIQIFK